MRREAVDREERERLRREQAAAEAEKSREQAAAEAMRLQ
jgi:hypothetical protein